MRGRQVEVQQRAAGIRVDFDEPRAVPGKVKVVTEEHASRPKVLPGRRRRTREQALAHGRGVGYRLERADEPGHRLDMIPRHEYRERRERIVTQVLPRIRKAGAPQARNQVFPKPVPVDVYAMAVAIEPVGKSRALRRGSLRHRIPRPIAADGRSAMGRQ